MQQGLKYYAFISYKHEDEKWAKWLQSKIEHYHFPTNLNGRADLPKHIRPVFRDVTDLNPGFLSKEINDALKQSQWLIVICSPRSAQSPWVCKEAQTFIDLGRSDRIIPFVIEGSPFSGNPSTECYPQALLNLTGRNELLAANIQEAGRNAAFIRVVSGMFGLRFDSLWQRYKRYVRKRYVMAFLALLSILVASLAILLGLRKREWKVLENQSCYVAETAIRLANDHLHGQAPPRQEWGGTLDAAEELQRPLLPDHPVHRRGH